MKEIRAIPVMEDAFRRYGELTLVTPQRVPHDDNENLTVWFGVAQFGAEGRSSILLKEKRRPMVLFQMERHVKTVELFACVDGRIVAVFAPGSDPDDPHEVPDPEKVEAFIMDDVASFTVERGVWHWPAFPLTETATQVVDFRSGTAEEDVEVKGLSEPRQIVVWETLWTQG